MARLVIVTVPDLASGYRLAGCAVAEAPPAPDDLESLLDRLTADPEVGIVGVHQPLLEALDPATRRRFEDLAAPVVIPVPPGTTPAGRHGHRARLAALLQRAIGYRIEFGEEHRVAQ